MVLLALSGKVSSKILVSSCIPVDKLRHRLRADMKEVSAYFFLIKGKEISRLARPAERIGELHEQYHCEDGYLHLEVVQENTF